MAAKTRHGLTFRLPVPASTQSDSLHPDKNDLRERILNLHAAGLSYREIGQQLGLHWTRVGQIVSGKARA